VEAWNSDAFSDGVSDPFGTPKSGTWTWSLYATYTTGSSNSPPTATIATPAASLTWKTGDTISFSGSATDSEDGALPASALSWLIRIKHCDPVDPTSCHYHTITTFTGASGSFTAPDHAYPSYVQIDLTATDSGGATDTRTVLLNPQTVSLTLQSVPTGMTLGFNFDSPVTPSTKTVIVSSTNSISAPNQTLNGTCYTFSSWSDGGLQTHNITAPAVATTYTATYVSGGSSCGTTGTLGTTSVGVNVDPTYSGLKWGDTYVLGVQGTFSKVSAYLSDNASVVGATSLRAAIYADVGGVPGALKAQSSVVSVADGQAAGWVDFPISPGVTLPAGSYWIVLQGGAPQNGARRYGTSTGGVEAWNSDAFSDGVSDPFGTPKSGTWTWSLYGTYAAAP
jgi:hypothetical protein